MIAKRLPHGVFRCRDSETTRRFYEDFLGLRLACAFESPETKTGRPTSTLHTFFELPDGSCLAFFDAPDLGSEFKAQRDSDPHMALEVEEPELGPMMEKARAFGIETRGVIDRVFSKSIYFRDPNGYVIELTARAHDHAIQLDPSQNGTREKLAAWTAAQRRRTA